MKYANGDLYKGDWIDDKIDGDGIFKWSNGSTYENKRSLTLNILAIILSSYFK